MSITRLVRSAVAVAAFVGAVAVGAGTAHAGPEPQCVGSECNGLKPAADGCLLDATEVNKVVFQDNAAGGTSARLVVRLMYSATCNASWSRVTVRGTGTATATRAQAWIGGRKSTTVRVRLFAGSINSKMYSSSTIEVCGIGTWNGFINIRRCTSAG